MWRLCYKRTRTKCYQCGEYVTRGLGIMLPMWRLCYKRTRTKCYQCWEYVIRGLKLNVTTFKCYLSWEDVTRGPCNLCTEFNQGLDEDSSLNGHVKTSSNTSSLNNQNRDKHTGFSWFFSFQELKIKISNRYST